MTQNTPVNATLKDLVIEVDQGILDYYQRQSGTANRETSRPNYISGKIAYAPEGQAERLGEYGQRISIGSSLSIKTYLPASAVRTHMRFDELNVTITRNEDGHLHLTCVDPRIACEIPHTFEFNEKAHAALHSICGDPRPSPCESCVCPGKFTRKEPALDTPVVWG